MAQTLQSFHPNPGWAPAASLSKPQVHPSPVQTPQVQTSPGASTTGKHCILELYDCDGAKLDNEVFLRATITAAAKRAGATLLHLISHRFEPQGVTGLALLAESHISIHTWPESGYAAVDVFTCGDHTMPERACALLAENLEAGRQSLTSFQRETPWPCSPGPRLPSPPFAALL